jgi:hypothetical protein
MSQSTAMPRAQYSVRTLLNATGDNPFNFRATTSCDDCRYLQGVLIERQVFDRIEQLHEYRCVRHDISFGNATTLMLCCICDDYRPIEEVANE